MINEIKSLFKELQKEREFLYGDEIRGYIGKLTWTEWREEEEDFKVNKALYKIIDIAEEHPLIEVKIDKESGFPPWTLVEEVYSLNETLEEPPIDWEEIIENARSLEGKNIFLVPDPREAVSQAEVINTDVWASMGQEAEAQKRREVFRPFQVNQELLKFAPENVYVMHCLPAHRGEEITDEVMDGPNSIVFDQAENRMHFQIALLAWLLS